METAAPSVNVFADVTVILPPPTSEKPDMTEETAEEATVIVMP